MAATTATGYQMLPNAGLKMVMYITAATADSGDTLSVAADFDTVQAIYCALPTGAQTAGTFAAAVITIDAGGGNANNAYRVLVIGNQHPLV